MTFVSYARNFEDVLLWRVFREEGTGFYIDVGAGNPDAGSVTRAFYDRGWRGINVETSADLFARLSGARARDVNLRETIGTGPTLAGICRLHAPADIGFLRIAAGKATRNILAGADFAAFRPRVILVGAPPDQAEWEPLLHASGFDFAWFDGTSRFYLAREHDAALRRHFQVPVNVADDFIRADEGEAARRVIEAETRAAEAVAAERMWATRLIAAERVRATHAEAGERVGAMLLAEQLAVGRRESARARHLQERATGLSRDIEILHRSTSWRVTAPLRNAKLALDALRGRSAAAPAPEEAPLLADPFDGARRRLVTRHPPATELRAVHQFHSGATVGDAITNAMLLTQRWLHKAGFRSEIYVEAEHRDPRLADLMLTADDLPETDSYVLIVRHSMGHGSCERIASLPAPKILLYHNITPAGLLFDPTLRYHAELGRAQLGQLRPYMRAALADSEFNALELRRHGYASPRVCTFLFDVEAMKAHRAPRNAGGPFTVLFVGRIAESKAQADLVDAFAAFKDAFGAPCRLILIGRTDSPSRYDAEVRRRIAANGLEQTVVLTGTVPDGELERRYRDADLYVSLSRHEGFGVPLAEAMARGIPVLAWPAGAVPYTLGDTAGLLADRSAETVAAAMLRLARDSGLRAEMAARQAGNLERFRLDRQFPVLIQALTAAGAALPRDPETRAALVGNLGVAVCGHVLGTYSLASMNRSMAFALESARPGKTRVLPIETVPIADLSLVPSNDRDAIAALAARPAPPTGPEVVICQHYPVLVPDQRADAAIAMLAWEESLLPPASVETLNRSFDAVLAASRFTAKALVDSGVARQVRAVGYPLDLSAFARLGDGRRGEMPGKAFTFLHVSSCFPRKGVDLLLAVFAATFRRADNVRLVIKGFPNPHNDVSEQIGRLRATDPDAPEIVLVNEDMDHAGLLDLFQGADAMVLPTRGEGFNIPAAEAMAVGVPLIVTGYGGHLDFCTADEARLLDFRFVPSASHLATVGSVWVEPDEADLARALREAVADARQGADAGGGASGARAERARRVVQERLSGWAETVTDFAADILTTPPMGVPRLAWISTWNVACGIAEYSRFLLTETADPDIDVTVLCDDRTTPPLGSDTIRVRPAWATAHSPSVDRLARAVAVADADIVVIQHHPGLIGWRDLARLLTDRRVLARTTVVTLHAAERLHEIGAAERAEAVAGLARATRVLVHRVADLNLLKDLGLVANVTLFPQGAPAARTARAARPLGPDMEAVIGSYGFFLPHKGIDRLIEAVARLRSTWPSLRLRLVNAEYPAPQSQDEIARCRALAHDLGIETAIEWHTAFLDTESCMRLLGGCDLLALPYEPSPESSSASLRGAMAAGVAVAVTPVTIFEEAGDAVHRFVGTDVEAIAAGLDALLRDQAARRRLQREAASWLGDRDWGALGTRMRGMLTGLHASR